MHNPELQIMIHGKNIASFKEVTVNHQRIQIQSVVRTENPNYIFLNLNIKENLEAGIYLFSLSSGTEKINFNYEFKQRAEGSAMRKGFDSSDVIYLIMSDRFSNGDNSNDSVEAAIEGSDRNKQSGRHGGDIKGIINQLDYLDDLGITAIWNTPLLFDNEPTYSYHTYAISDYYRIDPRYGTNEDYRELADACHQRNMKLIMDMVPNHCGISHWWMADLPQSNWIHPFEKFTRSNHRKTVLNDPYVAKVDYNLYNEGWFDTTMPDLNQTNVLLLTYLTQNAIWWIEFAGLDGLRVDTYPYNEKWAIAKWSKSILEAYPNLNIVGECWQHRPSELAYWQSGVKNHDGYNSYLPSGMDFCLTDALALAFNENEQHWDQGLARLYNSLATDYLYADPLNLLIFCDNHDITRYSETIQNDKDKFKLAFSFLLTTRGIPQIYYGTEIMMPGSKSKGDGDIRRDFPGGWSDDDRSAFTREGRTEIENEIFDHFRTLLRWRRNNPVIHDGKMVHFIPENNIYTYFRKSESKKVMVILNNNTTEMQLEMVRFKAELEGWSIGIEILSGKKLQLDNALNIPGKSAFIIELEMHDK